MNSLVLVESQPVAYLETETVNVFAAMAGLSKHTQRAYRRWISRYLVDINQKQRQFNFKALEIDLVIASLGAAQLKAWLGHLKALDLGKQSIVQAKSAVVWIAQFMADLGRLDYTVPAGLSKVKAPRAETGQRAGTWLTPSEIRLMLQVLRSGSDKPRAARNTAMVVLMVMCGLRRDEIVSARWSDMGRQGGNSILRVHGKGEKLRIVKLPGMVVEALELWRIHHPDPTGNQAVFTRISKGGTVRAFPLSTRVVWLVVQQAAQDAQIPRISPHDLRRSFARGAYEAGVSFELIRQALGHSNVTTTERYVNSALELDRGATDIWAEVIEESA
jgi:site-specific recombinase XerD